jgi:acetyl esterase/lipase
VLDIYLPTGEAPYPTLFMVHGGGYVFGSKGILNQTAQHFVGLGYAVVAPNYRLAPQYTYPAQIEDLFCALAWTLEHADQYNLDRERFVLLGESAGANGAAMLATVDDPARYLTDCQDSIPTDFEAQAVVALYMPVDLASCECEAARSMAALYLGVEEADMERTEQLRELWREASPLTWIDNSDPAFLLIHGSADDLVPISESEMFAEAYRAVGGVVDFITLEGAPHGFFAYPYFPAARTSFVQIETWLQEQLLSPQR